MNAPYLTKEAIRQYATELLRQYARARGKSVTFPLDAADLFGRLFGLATIYDDQGVLNKIELGLIGCLFPDGHISPWKRDKVIAVNVTTAPPPEYENRRIKKRGPLSPSAAIRLAPLLWDQDMEEADEEPPYIILPDKYFTIYEHGRRILLSGHHPTGLDGQRGIPARAWRAYQHRMRQEPPWERAERYQQIIAQQGFRSIRALAKVLGEDHSRMAKVLMVQELPERVLAVLRAHANHARIRAHFTERYLRQLVKENRDEQVILQEIDQILQEGRPAR